MSDWFSREIPVAKPAVPKKPNPLDASNEKKIEELEAKIKKYVAMWYMTHHKLTRLIE